MPEKPAPTMIASYSWALDITPFVFASLTSSVAMGTDAMIIEVDVALDTMFQRSSTAA